MFIIWLDELHVLFLLSNEVVPGTAYTGLSAGRSAGIAPAVVHLDGTVGLAGSLSWPRLELRACGRDVAQLPGNCWHAILKYIYIYAMVGISRSLVIFVMCFFWDWSENRWWIVLQMFWLWKSVDTYRPAQKARAKERNLRLVNHRCPEILDAYKVDIDILRPPGVLLQIGFKKGYATTQWFTSLSCPRVTIGCHSS